MGAVCKARGEKSGGRRCGMPRTVTSGEWVEGLGLGGKTTGGPETCTFTSPGLDVLMTVGTLPCSLLLV